MGDTPRTETVGTHRTCLERQMHGYLKSFGFVQGRDFDEQYSTPNGRVLDFILQLRRKDGTILSIDIETDGTPWHSSKVQMNKDAHRDRSMRSIGYTVVRFREPLDRMITYKRLRDAAQKNGAQFPPFVPDQTGD